MRNLSCTIILLIITFWVNAQSPHGNDLNIDCALCHSSKSWVVNRSDVKFNHDSTRFDLVGQHNFTNCRDCHGTLVFTDASTDCATCHTDVHTNTVGKDCARCHTPNTWLIEKTTEMHQQGRFPLMGGHRNVSCSACHVSATNLAFEPLGIECIDCHRANFLQTSNPNHVSSNFSTNCTECHQVDALNWNAENIDHSFFPLTNGHNIACVECHTNGRKGKIPANCIDCHQTNFIKSETPKHSEAGIPTTCEECHTPSNWKPSDFNHSATGFELTGGHRLIEQCSECHKGSLVNASQECINCHQVQYDYAPEHKQFDYPFTCTLCHTTNDWLETNFDHNATNFPLVGKHVGVDCATCHTNGFTGTSNQCSSCHLSDFQTAQLPSHTAAGIPVSCENCHTPSNWKPSGFNHSSTGYQLTGGHLFIDQCSDCHHGTISNASQECLSCHQSQYNGAPQHLSQSYPTSCILCHSTSNWLETNFDHSNTNFPLTGAHTSVECSSCHSNGFSGISTACISCHQSDYNSTTNPNHAAANFPDECNSCHSVNSWKPATFNHDSQYFPIYSGKHRGEWNSCTDCHTNSSNYAVFSCIDCHEHNKTDMDKEHRGENGYSYVSSACYNCHPDGRD